MDLTPEEIVKYNESMSQHQLGCELMLDFLTHYVRGRVGINKETPIGFEFPELRPEEIAMLTHFGDEIIEVADGAAPPQLDPS